MTDVVNAGITTVTALDAAVTAVSFDPANAAPAVVRVGCNRAFHVIVSIGATVATQTNAMIVMSGCEFLRVNPGETISVIAATGETAGIVTFTMQGET